MARGDAEKKIVCINNTRIVIIKLLDRELRIVSVSRSLLLCDGMCLGDRWIRKGKERTRKGERRD